MYLTLRITQSESRSEDKYNEDDGAHLHQREVEDVG